MKESIRIVVVLAVICLGSGAVIDIVHKATRDTTAMRKRESELRAVSALMPSGAVIEERSGRGAVPSRYWVSTRGGRTNTYAFIVTTRGYIDDITFIAVVDTLGVILGLQVLSQNETPGLGGRILERTRERLLWTAKAGGPEGPTWFTEQFVGLNLDNRILVDSREREWHRLGDIGRQRLARANAVTAITGASVTTSAVVKGLQTGIYPALRALRQGGASAAW